MTTENFAIIGLNYSEDKFILICTHSKYYVLSEENDLEEEEQLCFNLFKFIPNHNTFVSVNIRLLTEENAEVDWLNKNRVSLFVEALIRISNIKANTESIRFIDYEEALQQINNNIK